MRELIEQIKKAKKLVVERVDKRYLTRLIKVVVEDNPLTDWSQKRNTRKMFMN